MKNALVIIPTYNEIENIEAIIRAVFSQSDLVHVLIVDDNSPDGIKEIVERRHGEPIKFLFLPKMGLLGSQAGNEKNCWL
mgnify:CR=1 FL=1